MTTTDQSLHHKADAPRGIPCGIEIACDWERTRDVLFGATDDPDSAWSSNAREEGDRSVTTLPNLVQKSKVEKETYLRTGLAFV
jgi:hypothetical protein